MILTANNQRVQTYILQSQKSTTKAKSTRLALLEQLLEASGTFLSEQFPRKQHNVLDQILYLTAGAGIAKIGADRLANLTDVSERTVSTVVKKLKDTNQFIVARLNTGRAGKYIFVDKLHANFREIMDYVFSKDATQFAYQFASLDNYQTLDAVKCKEQNPSSNYNNSFSSKHALSLNNYYIDNQDFKMAVQEEINIPIDLSIEQQQKQISLYATNEYQQLLFDFISTMPVRKEILSDAYKIALSIGSDATNDEFNVAKIVFVNLAMDIGNGLQVKKSVRSMFSQAFQNAVARPKLQQVATPAERIKKVKPYNWLEEREETSSAIKGQSKFSSRLGELFEF